MPVINLNIIGMTCGSCTYMIEDVIGDLPGVVSAKCDVNAKTGVFELEEGASTTADEIVSIINGLQDGKFKSSLVSFVMDKFKFSSLIISKFFLF